MTSFADALPGAMVLVGLLGVAQGSSPAPLERDVTERIARIWRVAPESIRLAWGRAPRPESPGAALRIVGNGSGGWFTAVIGAGDSALAMRVRAGTAESVRVAARPLERGSSLVEDDMKTDLRVRWGPPAAVDREASFVGWEVRRPIAADEPIVAPSVAPPPLIRSGEPVRMRWERGGVSVSLAGIALNSARRGERVCARVEGRGTRLEGTASEPGVAVLAGGAP